MQKQLARGKTHEYELDHYFRQAWDIVELSLEQERQGMGDRRFAKGRCSFLVEYKSDEVASSTGNAFVETISVDTTGKAGWAYTCQADYIFYYLPLDRIIYVLKPDAIRQRLPEWQSRYRTAHTSHDQNDGYRTHGILVPLREFERCADCIVTM